MKLLFIIILLFLFRYNLTNILTIIIGSLFFERRNNYILANDIYISDNDMSGPAFYSRLGLTWESWMKPIIKKYCNPNKVSLDIGAHMGLHTREMAKYSKTVIAFEPNNTILESLYFNTQHLNNVIIVEKAIGDSDKIVKFNDETINSHSFVEPFTTSVQQIALDNYNIGDVGFIKIDIEGYEIQAFKGMQNLIQMYKPVIIFEDHTGDTIKYLTNQGYKVEKINSTNFLAK